MNKDAMQFILTKGHQTPLLKMSQMFGISVKKIRKFMRVHKIQPFYIQRHKQRLMAAETRSKTNEIRAEENKEYESAPWPKPTTDMSRAMRGKSYGGNIAAPGTKNPTQRSAVHHIQFTMKSSMSF